MHGLPPALAQYLQAGQSVDTANFRIETDDEGSEIQLIETGLGFHHSFVAGPMARRAQQSKQALLKACSDRKGNIRTVLDLTAGWGTDALTLAHHGRRVCLLEIDPLLYAMLRHARQCLLSGKQPVVAQRMEILQMNASDFLGRAEAARTFDCIYLDPMFPPHKSGAKPGKEMQILQTLAENRDIETCFELALTRAAKRVVVKRPARAPRLSNLKPDFLCREKTIRFDVYLIA